MAVVLFPTNLNHWSPALKRSFVMTSPSTGYWKHASNDRPTDEVSARLASRSCHFTRSYSNRSSSSRWRRIVRMAELVLPSETYGSSNRWKQPGRRFEESSPGNVRNKCKAKQWLCIFCCSWHGSMLDIQVLFQVEPCLNETPDERIFQTTSSRQGRW